MSVTAKIDLNLLATCNM